MIDDGWGGVNGSGGGWWLGQLMVVVDGGVRLSVTVVAGGEGR